MTIGHAVENGAIAFVRRIRIIERHRSLALPDKHAGADAHGIGLVDVLGHLPLAIARAKELAGLGQDASVWTVEAPSKYLLPKLDDPSAWLPALAPLLRERAWLLQDVRVTLR